MWDGSELIALGDVCVCSGAHGIPVVVCFMCCWCALGLAGGLSPSAFISVCFFISLSTADQWVLKCRGGGH